MTEIIQINSNTWSIEDGFVRFFLLVGEEKAAMIDSGVNSPNALEIAQKLTNNPIMLVNTHGDGDHTSGTNAFDEIYMHSLDYDYCEVGLRFANTSLVELNDGDIIDLGNRPIKVVHIPGHTRGSLAFIDIINRVLYAGDSVQKGHIYMFGDKRNIEEYENSLNKLISLRDEYDYIYASHDELCLNRDYVEKVKNAWKQVREEDMPYEIIDLFGNKVKSYSTETCGFYLE